MALSNVVDDIREMKDIGRPNTPHSRNEKHVVIATVNCDNRLHLTVKFTRLELLIYDKESSDQQMQVDS